MTIKSKEIGSEFFPKYDFYNKAISYPYLAPSKPFSFANGKCLEGIHVSLENRIPILSVGSNRSPYQLMNKFSLFEDLCVVNATLINSDIVYSASISSYGSIPATQWPLKGSEVKLNVLWLNDRQLNTMHLTEGIGIAYNFAELKEGSVIVKDVNYKGPVYGYISINGAYNFNDKLPVSLSILRSLQSKLKSKNELQALKFLKNHLGIGQMSLKKWIQEVIENKDYRIQLVNKMAKESLIPNDPPWKVIKVNVRGRKIV